MLPPSPSAPRSFDSSAYSSPHLQTPSSASSNAGECVFHPTRHETVWLLSNCYKNGFCLRLPHRAHISWGVSAGPGSRKWAAGHESQPGSVLGQITVSDRQSMPFGNREGGESVVQGWNYLKKKKKIEGGTRVIIKHRTELQRGLGEPQTPKGITCLQILLWSHLTYSGLTGIYLVPPGFAFIFKVFRRLKWFKLE